MPRTPPIIVTGMHRSGTSLTASLLAAVGVDMGGNLLPADINNTEGYFEDVDFLDLNRKILHQACKPDEKGHPDWGWTESEHLDEDRIALFSEEASELLAMRYTAGRPWGWKDPRTSLLLEFWNALAENARYILVYRFPWDVADSMQRLGAEVFLRDASYAYRIWTFYNRRLRDFYKSHSDRCILVSVNALRSNLNEFAYLLEKKLALNIRPELFLDRYRNDRLHTCEDRDPLIDLINAAWPHCTELLTELDDLADISGAGLWRAQPLKSRLRTPDRSIDDKSSVDVSVVIPCFNQGVLLLEAVASVERTAPSGSELIIVNDGSTEARTLEIIALLKAAGYFVIDQENMGLSAARNAAIRIARGRYILPLDDDNRLTAGFISDAVAILDSQAAIGVVYGYRNEFGLRNGVVQVKEFDLPDILNENYIDACALFRKKIWLDCGGYDASMSLMEDWELWIHAAELGWAFSRIPRVTFDYRVRPDSLISAVKTTEILDEFRARVRTKHPRLYLTAAIKQRDEARHLIEIERARGEEITQDMAAKIETLEHRIDDQENQISLLRSEIRLKHNELRDVSIQLDQSNALNAWIANSFGGRALTLYGRFKYKYLLPIYRLFGRGPTALSSKNDGSSRLKGNIADSER